MASVLLANLLKESLEIEPYSGREYLADSVGDLPNEYGSGDARAYWKSELGPYGSTLWRFARMALNYWTPDRVEQEAYRRAGDQPSVSKIAQEVARFNVIYGKWVELAQRFLTYADFSHPRHEMQLSFLRESLAETLLALERRAQAAEQRATDLRLRYEFDKLRQVVSGRAMASEIAALIQEAVNNVGREKAVFERFAPALARLEKEVSDTKLDVQFIADLVGDDFVAKQLPMAKYGPAVLKLMDVVPGVAGKVLAAFARLFIKG